MCCLLKRDQCSALKFCLCVQIIQSSSSLINLVFFSKVLGLLAAWTQTFTPSSAPGTSSWPVTSTRKRLLSLLPSFLCCCRPSPARGRSGEALHPSCALFLSSAQLTVVITFVTHCLCPVSRSAFSVTLRFFGSVHSNGLPGLTSVILLLMHMYVLNCPNIKLNINVFTYNRVTTIYKFITEKLQNG